MISRGIFRQYDIRGVVGTDLDHEVARAVGKAFGLLLAEKATAGTRGPVVVGRDNRPSGTELRDALVDGLQSVGRDVIDIGVVPTPLMYWALNHLPVAGGIQVTGSHNPSEFNGFKLCRGTASVYGAEIQRLFELAQKRVSGSNRGAVTETDVIPGYLDDIAARIGSLKRPLKVVVDCGNGAGSLVMPALLDRLGVNATLLYAESDGTFPNHHPDPTVVANLQDLIATVRREKADLGIGLDGDADRIGLVDGSGTIVWGDYLLLIYARDVLARTGKGQSIIFDVKCSQALPDAIVKAGGKPVMWKTGHSLIKEKMKELRAPVAGEMSGHMFFTEGFYGHDDALYAAARLFRIVADTGKSVTELLSDVPTFVSTPEIRVDCPDDRKFTVVEAAVRHFKATHEVIDVDGARILYGDGWGLIRASNTQPILVLRVEAKSTARLEEIRDDLGRWLATQGVAMPRD